MLKEHPLQRQLQPIVENMDYEIVRIITIGNMHPTLQIMIERKDRKNITVDDCACVSRAVSAFLDENDPMDGRYTLEISSPGLDRPLTKIDHFIRFIGFEAKIETQIEINKRKRFKGKIVRVDNNDTIIINMNDEEYAIPFENITKSKLLLTDELLAAAENNQEIEE